MKMKLLLIIGMIVISPVAFVSASRSDSTLRGETLRGDSQSPQDEANQTIKPVEASSTVGFPRLIYQHVIPGSKVVAKPIVDRTQQVLVRIVDTYPHGTSFRYDIEYQGLEPGQYNIADYLAREDGSSESIPPINVEIRSLLGDGQVVPSDLPQIDSRFRNYYSPTLIGLGVVWVAGLIVILFFGRHRKKRIQAAARPRTVADRLRPLIDLAAAGELTSQQSAELERVLSAFWCKKLGLSELSANDLRERLRGHQEASRLLEQIDIWLHRPSTDRGEQVDVNEMLEPYRSMRDEEV